MAVIGRRDGPRLRGRVEYGLAKEMADSELPDAAKMHLAAAAALVDIAEKDRNVDAGAKAVRAYLELRQAYGLAGGRQEPLDPFAAFVAGLASPSMGHPENT